MRGFLPVALLVATLVEAAAGSQFVFNHPSDPPSAAAWDTPPHPDTTDHHIFRTVNSLLQRWPNTIHRNGHTIVPATIPIGTVLYHGRTNASVPTVPEWLGFDFEHAYLFCIGPCYVISFMAARDLRLAYFDGTSAANMPAGTLDSQDIVIWGETRPDKFFSEYERIRELCAWGKPLGVDGFVRMEFHFEVLLCDFSAGLELVTLSDLLPKNITFPHQRVPRNPPPKITVPHVPSNRSQQRPHQNFHRSSSSMFLEDIAPPGSPRRPIPQPDPPRGWKGSLPVAGSVTFEALVAGSWHNNAPGETRVRPDYSGVVSFYDRSLTSLVEARRGLPRPQHQLANLSSADALRVREELAGVFGRTTGGSGVDWGSITRVVVERYADRLELLRYLSAPPAHPNVSEQAALVRRHLLTMLVPYITVDSVPSPDASNSSWAAAIVDRCSTTQTSHIPNGLLTAQEHHIREAVEGTLREICRRLTIMWAHVFDIELEADEDRTGQVLDGVRTEVADLMAWLDWSVWVKCDPGCRPDEMCYVPSWFFFYWRDEDPDDMTPRCISKLNGGW